MKNLLKHKTLALIVIVLVITGVILIAKQLNPKIGCDTETSFDGPISHKFDFASFNAPSSLQQQSIINQNDPANPAPDCDIALKNGYYDYEMIKSNEAYHKYFYDYIYQSNFQSKDEMISAGISLNAILPAIPAIIDAAGNFNKTAYQQWRSTYSSTQTHIEDRNTSYEYIRRNVPDYKYKAWIECYKLVYGTKQAGLFVTLKPLNQGDQDYAELSVRWNATNGIGTIKFTKDIYIKGGIASCTNIDAFKKGSEIGSQEINLLIKRKPSEDLIVQLFPSNSDNQPIHTLAKKYFGDILKFGIQENSGGNFVGDSITLDWEVLNGIDVKLDNQMVNYKGTRKVFIADTALRSFKLSSYKGKKSDGQDDIETRIIHFQGKTRPSVLQKTAQIRFATPSWADGKEGNSSFDIHVNLTDSLGNTVVGKGACGIGFPITRGSVGDFIITFNESEAARFLYSKLKRTEVKVSFREQHKDAWRARIQLLLKFTQGKELTSPVNDPAYNLNFKDATSINALWERNQMGEKITLFSNSL